MSAYCICTILDERVGSYMRPMILRSRGEAMRLFQDSLKHPENTTMRAHPEDFALYYLGSFDDETGIVVGVDPELLCRGKDFADLDKEVLQ